MTNKKKEQKGPFEEVEYVGNIWGWKFSFISLGIILFMLGLMLTIHLKRRNLPKVENTEQNISIEKLDVND